jgi:3-deoxy-D-manno-octulosonic-acid transferase
VGNLSRPIIRSIFLLEYLLHGFLMPFVFVLLPFFKGLRARYQLERKFNSRSLDLNPEYSFEVSSEGELEQVAPILIHFLDLKKEVQLIIGSKSLAKRAQILSDTYELLDVRMVPLVSFFWFKTSFTTNLTSLIKARNLILCRYDFFPELMLIGGQRDRNFILVSASLKNKNLLGLSKLYWRGVYSLFDQIIAASSLEEEQMRRLLPVFTGAHFDFRQLQVLDRIEASHSTLQTWKHNECFELLLNRFSREKRFIVGSCWEQECEIFLDKEFVQDIIDHNLLVVLAPHVLSNDSVNGLIQKIKEKAPQVGVSIITEGKFPTESTDGVIYILQKSGILVELYQKFGHAFVGGGYGRSIHSVLEPFISGCQVYCGPKTHRSTEFDLIVSKNTDQAIIVESQKEFYTLAKEKIEGEQNMAIIKRSELDQQFLTHITRLMEGS